ncbi:DNA mismatch repair protein MutS2 [Dehalogenimonas formicexedens]|uniref:Endonuclease MutS2 n=1 Tax=Dehalogenimonas formicexedens TaxID=1839801 RepID=A0A1P8F7A8_9CHLR|nr:endonuclease MutS2 [Dehalogenimonas formicexedens]APV44376.1 DNA mismatch repair protein MutS2 [Dehalogenimonas formicexedens]
MLEKDLSLLEFPRVRDIIAGYCAFSLSRELALALEPYNDIDPIKARLEESAEARRFIELEPNFSVHGLIDVSQESLSAARGRILEPKTLSEIGRSLGILKRLKSKLVEFTESMPLLSAISSEIGVFGHLEKSINRAVSPEGELLPDASDKLAGIRERLRGKRAEVVDRLQNYIHSDATRRYIQEPIVTEREGRFSIAVKAEYKGEIKGIVHDVSNSGATVFVEPFATLELGNEFKELEIEEVREIERILSELSESVGSVANSIESSLDAAARIDFAFAKGHYAIRHKAHEALIYEPTPSDPPFIKLDEARHPLLGASAVPLSLELGRDYSILVITGPNTGGKTVALKTIALMCLMTQAGLPIPASEKTRLPLFHGVFADIGDEQSVQAALSTFSGHMSNIARILTHIQGTSLVVLDELGASTDPQEGSALARAILQHLKTKNVLAAATSHYTELKVFAHVTPGLQNASFDFDPMTLTPTYHLTLGMPGGSNAIATAARFGVPSDVIDNAKALLAEGARQLDDLLTELQADKKRLEDLNKMVSRQKDSLQAQNKTLLTELKNLREQRQAILQQARDSVVEEVAALQKDMKLARSALEREKSQAAIANAREVSDLVRERLRQGVLKTQASVASKEDAPISLGDRVWLKEAEIEAVVTGINQKTGQFEVSSGPLRFILGREGLSKTGGAPANVPAPKISVRSAGKYVGLELDLRGKRADDIEPLLDEYLNEAATANLPEVRIIHGFGTGAVRSIVREIAAKHPLVASFHSAPRDQGGDGATVLRLK